MATFLTATAERPQPPRNAGASSPSRVEDAQFPGVDACDALPNGVVAADVMKAALQHVAFRTPVDRARFAKVWAGASCQRLLVALVWHTLCDKHGAGGGAASAEELVTQIASAYVGLVSAPSLRQDVVSWYLPEALAHAASGALLAAYPKSASHFDARCRQQLFEQIVAWTSGFAGRRTLGEPAGGAGAASASPRHGAGGATPRARPLVYRGGARSARGAGHDDGEGGGSIGPRLRLEQLLVDGGASAAATARSGKSPPGERGGARPGSPRQSVALGRLPAAKRSPRDLAATSPLLAKWIQDRNRHREARGGAAAAREPHRVSCSEDAARRAAEGRLAAINAPTYRDVRREAARNHEQRSAAVGRASAEASHELAAMHGSLAAAVNALRIEEKLVKERGHANQYANYLVSMRLMNENADD